MAKRKGRTKKKSKKAEKEDKQKKPRKNSTKASNTSLDGENGLFLFFNPLKPLLGSGQGAQPKTNFSRKGGSVHFGVSEGFRKNAKCFGRNVFVSNLQTLRTVSGFKIWNWKFNSWKRLRGKQLPSWSADRIPSQLVTMLTRNAAPRARRLAVSILG